MKSPCNIYIKVLIFLLSSIVVPAIANGQLATNASTAQSDSVRVLSTPLTGFGVPFSINDPSGRYIEVHLYVSKDRGQSWQYHDRTSPQETQFPFQSKGDGEYWFALKTLDRDRKLNPDGEPRPELKVIVDSRKPTLDLEVKSDQAGRLVCKWRAEDRFIEPTSLKISYKAASNVASQWKSIEYRPIHIQSTGNVFADQLAWWPEISDQEVQVRLQVNDRAGNTVSDLRNVFVPRIANRSGSVGTANRIPQNRIQPQRTPPQTAPQTAMHCENGVCRLVKTPSPGGQNSFAPGHRGGNFLAKKRIGSLPEYIAPPRPAGSPSPDTITASAAREIKLDPARGRDSRPDRLASGTPNRKSAEPSQGIVWDSRETLSRGDQKQVVSSTAAGQGGSLFDRDNFDSDQVVTATTAQHRNPLALGGEINRQTSGNNSRPPLTPPARAQNPQTPDQFLGPRPPMRNVSQPMTENPLTKPVRPLPTASDFGHVSPAKSAPPNRELRPRGSASKMKSINSRRFLLNYNVDAIDPSGVGKVVLWVTRNGGQTWSSLSTDNDNKSPFPVQLDEDGEFGFRVVIHSKDGLVGRPPSRGDEADMSIRIDTEAPSGKIVSVPYGTGNDVGRLVINWRADDSQLRTKPIDLAYSTNPSGPWTNIEQGVRNTGSYSWKVSRDIPDRIYLRMAIHDAAGNTTVQKLTQPIDVSGLVPRGRINGVQAITTQ